MDNQIYSIVEGFVKEVEQDKKHPLLVKSWHVRRGPKTDGSTDLNLMVSVVKTDCWSQ